MDIEKNNQKSPEALKIKPENMKRVLAENPKIEQNEEYFLIPFEVNGKKETHYIPKRDSIKVKFDEKNIGDVDIEKVIRATKKYPEKPLSEALILINKDEK